MTTTKLYIYIYIHKTIIITKHISQERDIVTLVNVELARVWKTNNVNIGFQVVTALDEALFEQQEKQEIKC